MQYASRQTSEHMPISSTDCMSDIPTPAKAVAVIRCGSAPSRIDCPHSSHLSSLIAIRPSVESSCRPAPERHDLTAQGHPRAIFHRAIERGNLAVAETTLRELARPTLAELLELTILIAVREPRRHARVSARWLLRYLEVRDQATIDDAALVTACLVALGGDRQFEAATALRAMARTATVHRGPQGVA
jgi:hypothetical protein